MSREARVYAFMRPVRGLWDGREGQPRRDPSGVVSHMVTRRKQSRNVGVFALEKTQGPGGVMAVGWRGRDRWEGVCKGSPQNEDIGGEGPELQGALGESSGSPRVGGELVGGEQEVVLGSLTSLKQ